MTRKPQLLPRLESGVRNLDAIFEDGLPKGSVTVLSGPPGSGKTILAQQICFHNGTPSNVALYFSTLTEPTAKTLRYLSQFAFFDPNKLDHGVRFVDLGVMLRAKGLDEATALLMEHLRTIKPAIVVIDSFKVFDDLAKSRQELRRFGYEIAVNLMAWETTAFLLGEYADDDVATNPLFSIVDGLVVMSQRESSGESQRFFKVVKMRGTAHSRDEHSFVITDHGLEMFAPRVAIHREPGADAEPARLETRIAKLDEILGPGIPLGSSLLVSGVAGTGKTVLLLEFIYRGAQAGERGVLFSFEETEQRLRATAKGLGWDLEREIERGMVEIVFIPQPDIMVEAHLLMMRERVEALGAKRVALDSLSVFLHKVQDPQISREKVFHLATIVQNARAVGLFATDIAYGSNRISRFGVEETVVDGVILLTSKEEGLERQRYLEVYKLRNTPHLQGRHDMTIAHGGISLFPRYHAEQAALDLAGAPLGTSRRLRSGVPGLDVLLGGGLPERSVTLVSGSAGIGKTTLATQFILQGAKESEPGLYVTLEEGPEQLAASAAALGLPLRAAVDEGLVAILHLARDEIRAGQFLAVLADKIQSMKVRRLVLDAATDVKTEHTDPDDLRHLLYKLVVRFKTLGVTSLVTLEASALSATDSVTGLGLSPIADGLVMLRYAKRSDRLEPTLTVVKMRGSAHDRGSHALAIGKGGMRIGAVARAKRRAPRKRSRRA